VAALFLATVSAVISAAELLDLDHWIPDPAQLFSGARVFWERDRGSMETL